MKFQASYTDPRMRCKAQFTDYITCTKGVKQANEYSHVLFSVFVNELAIKMIQNGKHEAVLSIVY